MPIKRSLNSVYGEMEKLNINRERNNSNSKKGNYEIEGIFKPKMVNGKFTVVLRFLPNHPDEQVPFIENRSHMFQLANGQWFGCDCAKKWNEPCPICDYNAKVWTKYGRTDEARALVKDKWKPKYYSNVYIVKNPNQPDTEGKVFRLEYGRAIMKFITEAMAEKDDAELGKIPGINPFSWFGPNDECVLNGEEKAGANFVWEGVQGSNGPNYSTSHFSPARRICKVNMAGKLEEMTDGEIDVIESQLFTLKDIEKQKDQIRSYSDILNFYRTKSGEELMAEFQDGTSDYAATTNIQQNTVAVNDDEIFGGSSNMPFDEDEVVVPQQAPKPAPKPVSKPAPAVQSTDDEDEFFNNLFKNEK